MSSRDKGGASGRPRPAAEDIRAAAVEHARLLGCTCEPDVKADLQGGCLFLAISHDADCPLAPGGDA